jgi:hypothetical protein
VQILFLSGVSLIIGPRGVFRFFFQKRKARPHASTPTRIPPLPPPHPRADAPPARGRRQAKGTTCFLGGIFLVLVGWPIFGMAVEVFGFLNLFGDFFPVVIGFLRNLPVVGNLLALPPIRAFTDRFVSKARLPV